MSAPRKLLLLCSPGFGLIDAWLPVIKKLREREDVIIDFIFPEPSSLRLEEKNSDLFNLAETFVDNIIFRGYSGRWFTASSLIEARNGIKYGSLDKKILRFSSRLKKGALSKYLVMRVIGEYLLIVAKYIAHVKENLGKQDLYDIGLLRGANGLLYDVLLEEKSENNELMDKLKYIAKFSIAHGTDLRWISIDIPNNRKEVKDRSDVVVYAISNFEKKWYKEYFGILYGNMVHAGIPKHDNDWIKFVCSQHYSAEKYAFDSFVFIIGRPASPYNTPNRKKKALEDIYDIV